MKRTIIFLLVIFALTACGTGSQSDEIIPPAGVSDDAVESNLADAKQVITFAVNSFEQGLYEGRIEGFEKNNPNMRLEIVTVEEILGSSIFDASQLTAEQAIKLAKSADVLALAPNQLMIDQELVLNLAPLMDGDNQVSADDFLPGILEQHQQNGGTWALPTSATYALMFYNKTMFDAAGVAYPENGWSWSDFLSKAKALTKTDGSQWGFSSGFIPPSWMIEAYAQTPIYDTSVQPAKINLNDPKVVEAVKWYAELTSLHQVSQSFADFGEGGVSFEDPAEISAMWMATSDSLGFFSGDVENVGAVSFPIANEDDLSSPIGSVFAGGSAFSISAGSNKVDGAWRWIKFLSQQDSQESELLGVTALPARRAAAEADGVLERFGNAADAIRFALDHAFVPTQPPGDVDLSFLASQVADDGQNAEQVLDEAQATAEAALKKQVEDQDSATPVPEFTVAEPPSEQVEEGQTVINFIVMNGDTTPFKQAAEQFQKANPSIVVKVKEPNYFSSSGFSLESIAEEADCMLAPSEFVSEFNLNSVLAIQPFIDADPEISVDDFYPAALESFNNEGQLMGVPSEILMKVLGYDKAKFDAAGLPYPQLGWTMDEFLQTAVALTDGNNDRTKTYGFVPSDSEIKDILLMMSRHGAQFVDDTTNPETLTFTHPDTISAMRWYTNLSTEHGAKPKPQVWDGFAFVDTIGLKLNGQAAMWAEGGSMGVIMIDASGGAPEDPDAGKEIGYAPYPTGKGGSVFDSTNGLFISANSENRQACWEWIKHVVTSPSLVADGSPAHIPTATSAEYAQIAGADKADLFIKILAGSEEASEQDLYFNGGGWISLTSFLLEKAHTAIVVDGVSVEDALQEAQIKADNLRACVVEKDAFDDGQAQFECFSTVDPSFQNFGLGG